jgi:hypothetical protein
MVKTFKGLQTSLEYMRCPVTQSYSFKSNLNAIWLFEK